MASLTYVCFVPAKGLIRPTYVCKACHNYLLSNSCTFFSNNNNNNNNTNNNNNNNNDNNNNQVFGAHLVNSMPLHYCMYT